MEKSMDAIVALAKGRGLFTLDALRCIGACGIAPAVSINGQVYPKMTVDKVQTIIDQYKALGGNN